METLIPTWVILLGVGIVILIVLLMGLLALSLVLYFRKSSTTH